MGHVESAIHMPTWWLSRIFYHSVYFQLRIQSAISVSLFFACWVSCMFVRCIFAHSTRRHTALDNIVSTMRDYGRPQVNMHSSDIYNVRMLYIWCWAYISLANLITKSTLVTSIQNFNRNLFHIFFVFGYFVLFLSLNAASSFSCFHSDDDWMAMMHCMCVHCARMIKQK